MRALRELQVPQQRRGVVRVARPTVRQRDRARVARKPDEVLRVFLGADILADRSLATRAAGALGALERGVQLVVAEKQPLLSTLPWWPARSRRERDHSPRAAFIFRDAFAFETYLPQHIPRTVPN